MNPENTGTGFQISVVNHQAVFGHSQSPIPLFDLGQEHPSSLHVLCEVQAPASIAARRALSMVISRLLQFAVTEK